MPKSRRKKPLAAGPDRGSDVQPPPGAPAPPAPPVAAVAAVAPVGPVVPPPRDSTPPAAPAYGISFGRVWRAALEVVRQSERWRVVESDPVRGEIAAEIRPLFRGSPPRVRIVVSLDELGLTRVHASLPGASRARTAAPPRQIAEFYRRLERLLARGA